MARTFMPAVGQKSRASTRRRHLPLLACIFVACAVLVQDVPEGDMVRAAAVTPTPAATVPFSPGKCRIEYVSNPHFSRDVANAVKVNVKTQCGYQVPELTLSVTLFADGQPIAKTITKAANKQHLMNEGTFVRCQSRGTTHNFKGMALGTSYEDGQLYEQIVPGPEISLPCDF